MTKVGLLDIREMVAGPLRISGLHLRKSFAALVRLSSSRTVLPQAVQTSTTTTYATGANSLFTVDLQN